MNIRRSEKPPSDRTTANGALWKPLVPVAVFAAFVEAVGLVVLPSFAPAIQDVFVWFLMLFPVIVVAMLLSTLYIRPRVGDAVATDEIEAMAPTEGAEIRELQQGTFEPIDVPAADVMPIRRH